MTIQIIVLLKLQKIIILIIGLINTRKYLTNLDENISYRLCGIYRFHLSKKLISNGHTVIGIDSINNYYGTKIKSIDLDY